ncbi:hypothetical protein VNO77_13344 [Canavalia gladiata]|uniref:Uncharacterized protein n=1 Tax=Canavalia gladiata TaxID=3824 RepID=A0AAN9QRK0_CANGL
MQSLSLLEDTWRSTIIGVWLMELHCNKRKKENFAECLLSIDAHGHVHIDAQDEEQHAVQQWTYMARKRAKKNY